MDGWLFTKDLKLFLLSENTMQEHQKFVNEKIKNNLWYTEE